MKIIELKPCISPGSHYKGVSSEGCSFTVRELTIFCDNPQDLSRPLTHLLPKCIISNILSFTAELFCMAFPSHACLASSRCSENLPILLLALLLPGSDFKLPIPSLSPSPFCFVEKITFLYICPWFTHGQETIIKFINPFQV